MHLAARTLAALTAPGRILSPALSAALSAPLSPQHPGAARVAAMVELADSVTWVRVVGRNAVRTKE